MRVIMMNSYLCQSELDSLRLGRDFGSVKLYSDNISSSRSISLFSGVFSGACNVGPVIKLVYSGLCLKNVLLSTDLKSYHFDFYSFPFW